MTGFKLQISGVGSNHTTNLATTTAHQQFASFFLKNGPNTATFCLFSFLSHDKYSTNLILNDESIDGVLGIWTLGGRMVSMEESTELWICQFYDETKSHKNKNKVSPVSNFETIFQWFRVSASCTFFDLTVKVFEPFFGQFQKICVQILFHFCKKIARSTFRNLLSRIIFCKV